MSFTTTLQATRHPVETCTECAQLSGEARGIIAAIGTVELTVHSDADESTDGIDHFATVARVRS